MLDDLPFPEAVEKRLGLYGSMCGVACAVQKVVFILKNVQTIICVFKCVQDVYALYRYAYNAPITIEGGVMWLMSHAIKELSVTDESKGVALNIDTCSDLDDERKEEETIIESCVMYAVIYLLLF